MEQRHDVASTIGLNQASSMPALSPSTHSEWTVGPKQCDQTTRPEWADPWKWLGRSDSAHLLEQTWRHSWLCTKNQDSCIQVVTFSPFDLDVFRKNPAQIISGTENLDQLQWQNSCPASPQKQRHLLPLGRNHRHSPSPSISPSSSLWNHSEILLGYTWPNNGKNMYNTYWIFWALLSILSWALKISKESKSDRCCHQLSL